MRQTEKYQFNLIDPENHFLPDPINENAEKTEAALNACPHIAVGTYEGSGGYGSQSPCTLTFDFTPKFVLVYETDMGSLTGHSFDVEDESGYWPSSTLIAAYGATRSGGVRDAQIVDIVTWGENSFTWYSKNYLSGATSARAQLNLKNTTYFYLAIG